MTAQQVSRRAPGTRSDALAIALEDRGLLDPARHAEAVELIDQTLAGREGETAGLRHRLVELAAYVGAAFVAAAIILFLNQQWPDLSVGQRVGLLAVVAVVLLASGTAVALAGLERGSLRSAGRDTRRRLASALLTGGAGSAGVTVAVWILHQLESSGSTVDDEWMVGAGTGATVLVLTALGYVVSPSLLGQLAGAAAAMLFLPFALEGAGLTGSGAHGTAVLATGVLWLLLAETERWHETTPARVLGSSMLLAGAQIPLELDWIAYLLTAVVALLGFVLYVTRRAWPYLVVGVAGLTVVVPEALLDWTSGSLGTAGVLLVAGLTLLGASLLGLRLRQETSPDT